jgi:hypothetical protein
MTSTESMRTFPFLLFALLLGCSTGGSMFNIGDNAWRVTAIGNTEVEATRVGKDQAIALCDKQGKVPSFATVQTWNDMPARHTTIMEFQCTAKGNSQEAQAEARMRGYQRDCALAGFTLGSPENIKCAADISAKPRPGGR